MKRLLMLSLLGMTMAGSARAQENAASLTSAPPSTPFSLSLDTQTQWRLDDSYRMFSRSRDEQMGGVSLSYDLVRRGRGALVVGAGFHGGSSHGVWGGAGFGERFGGSLESGLDVQTLAISAAFRWSWRPWLEPLVRVAVDGTWSKLSISFVDGPAFTDRTWTPGASAGAGLRLRTTPRTGVTAAGHHFGGAISVEGGFHIGSAMSYALSPPPPADGSDGKDRIPVTRTPIGDLGRTFPYLRVSFALLF